MNSIMTRSKSRANQLIEKTISKSNIKIEKISKKDNLNTNKNSNDNLSVVIYLFTIVAIIAGCMSIDFDIGTHQWIYKTNDWPFIPWGNITTSQYMAYYATEWIFPTFIDQSLNTWTYTVEYLLLNEVLAMYLVTFISIGANIYSHKKNHDSLFQYTCYILLFCFIALMYEACQQSESFACSLFLITIFGSLFTL